MRKPVIIRSICHMGGTEGRPATCTYSLQLTVLYAEPKNQMCLFCSPMAETLMDGASTGPDWGVCFVGTLNDFFY